MSKLFIIGSFSLGHFFVYDLTAALIFAVITLSLEVVFGK